MSDLFPFSFLSSWRFLICYSAAVPLARFHFCFIFGWFCRLVLRHTKSPRSRSDVTHTQGKRYPLDESDIYDAFIMKYFGFCLFLFQTKCCPPLLLYENFQIKWHRDNIATHMLYRVEIGAIFFLRISVLYRLFLLYSGEREGERLGVFIRKGLKRERRRYKLAPEFSVLLFTIDWAIVYNKMGGERNESFVIHLPERKIGSLDRRACPMRIPADLLLLWSVSTLFCAI